MNLAMQRVLEMIQFIHQTYWAPKKQRDSR